MEAVSKDIVIEPSVLVIEDGKYKNLDATTVTFLGENLIRIGAEAFCQCTQLQEISIPKGVVEIGDRAFFGCTALQYLFIPDSVRLIGENVLSGCNSLLEIIGSTNSKAKDLAQQYGLVFRTQKKDIDQRVFDVFGQTIRCSKSQIIYDEVQTFYSNLALGDLPYPTTIVAYGTSSHYFKYKCDRKFFPFAQIIAHLKQFGIDISFSDLERATWEYIGEIEQIMTAINDTHAEECYNLYQNRSSSLQNLSNNLWKNNRLSDGEYPHARYEMESKARVRELERYYQNRYDRAVAEELQKLRKVEKRMIERLRRFELDRLIKAGVLSVADQTEDPWLASNAILSKIKDDDKDYRAHIALALQACPTNTNAYLMAIKRGYYCEGISDMMRYLNQKDKIVRELRKKINALNNLKEAFDLVLASEYFTSNELKNLYDIDWKTHQITDSVERLYHEILQISTEIDAKEYVQTKLEAIINKKTWSGFERLSCVPIQSAKLPKTVQADFGALENYLIEECRRVIENNETTYQKILDIVANGKTMNDVCTLQNLIAELPQYKNVSKIKKTLDDYLAAKQMIANAKNKKALSLAQQEMAKLGRFLDTEEQVQAIQSRLKKIFWRRF